MGFSRQEYWSGLPFPPPGGLPDPGIEPVFLCLLQWQADSSPLCCLGSHLLSFYDLTGTLVNIYIHDLSLSSQGHHAGVIATVQMRRLRPEAEELTQDASCYVGIL